MRILITTFAWPSHYLPIVPLGWAARLAGHEVLVAASPTITDLVLESGLAMAPIGGDPAEALRRAGLSLEQSDEERAARRFDRASWREDWVAAPERITEEQRAYFRTIGGWATAFAAAQADELIALARGWRADVLVHDGTQFAAPVAAAVLGLPTARFLAGHSGMLRIDTAYTGEPVPAYRRLFERYGLAPEIEPTVWLDPCPPGLQYPYPAGTPILPMRYVPYNGRGVIPAWTHEPPRRPRVCLTWGHTGSSETGSVAVDDCRRTVEAIAALDFEVVVAVGQDLLDRLGELPAGVRAAVGVPLHALLRDCRAIVHHGGPGTTMTAVAAGVPQLVITDQPHNVAAGASLAKAGAGRWLLPSDAPTGQDGAAVLAAEIAVLAGDPGYRAAAERLRRENLAQPSLSQVIDHLEKL
ncbi:glycosyltransferase [Amycolatopsis xylanica]|uniref:Glycosyltransferase n=1 Tax=Amycolatopsis xylanica TaxID=589385 RepID=A0A1H2VS59_9PSEU|nr:nucleotide disphospho-sugar-binding domain-containing protein [Amycolatopsis xylanica]SDW71111.1 glycosyltransferase [Amycolatopsis xylanica]